MLETPHDLARRLGEQAEAVCRALLPKGCRQGRYWLCGDVLGTPGHSLYVRLSGPRAGHWADSATGEYGDLLDLIGLNRRLDFRATLAEARVLLSLPVPFNRLADPPAPLGSSEAVRRLFAASKPVRGTLAERYLRGRGIVLPPELSALRFHPCCFYRAASGRQTWPAMIAAVTNLDGALTGVHRTWLDQAGGKAPVDQPRRAMGHLLGNAVRFGAARDVLAAAEGIETALSLKTVLPALPVVAALSAAHLAALTLPPVLRRFYIARDNDAAGCRAVERLRDRFYGASFDLRVLTPRTEDFNADLLTLGQDRLRDWLATQLASDDIRRFVGAGGLSFGG